MSECDYQLRVSAYHDGELPADAMAEVERHLGQCPACAAELAAMRQMSGQIAGAVGEMSSAELVRLRRGVNEAASAERESLPMFRTMGLLGAMAASVLIVSGVWLMELRPTGGAGRTSSQNVALAPEWQRVAVTLHADPRPEVVQDSLYAPRYAGHMGLMLDGLMLSQR